MGDLDERVLAAVAWLEARVHEGVALVNDDFGHWAVAFCGMQNLPPDLLEDFEAEHGEPAPFDLRSEFLISKDRFRDTILEAVELARDDPE